MKKILLIIALITISILLISLINIGKFGEQVLGTMIYETESTTKKQPTKKSEKIVFETEKLYSLINSYRKENKLSPLQINQSLEISAKRKVADMIENNYFKHEDEDNIESWYLFKTAGYEYKTSGENLSSGANTPWKVFDAWKNSEKHNAQLLNNTYLDMGISVDCDSYKIAKRPSCVAVLHLGSK
ncbi:CAP domain-containing protein [Patescibacteria group bacterium]|nr:CAP domain-containing protein [Patescibacteria group bacterium]